MLKRVVIATLMLGTSVGQTFGASDTAAQYPGLPPAKNYTHVAQVAVDAVGKSRS